MAYTPEQEQAVREAAPLTLESAKAVGEKIGMSYRSVIAKAKSLDLEYIAKPKPAPKAKAPTKVELVGELESIFGRSLEGLEKAPKPVLEGMIKDMTERFTIFDA